MLGTQIISWLSPLEAESVNLFRLAASKFSQNLRAHVLHVDAACRFHEMIAFGNPCNQGTRSAMRRSDARLGHFQ